MELLATTALFAMSSLHAATPADRDLSSTLQAIVSDPVKPLSSLSALVIRDGQVVFTGHFGSRVMAGTDAGSAGKGIAADHDTLYRMASVSKLVATIGVMRLVDALRLDLDADIGPSTGDRFVAHGGATGFGHLGFAYGLESGFIFDPQTRNGVVYAMGGVSVDPDQNRGRYSAYSAWEERVLDALWRHVETGLKHAD